MKGNKEEKKFSKDGDGDLRFKDGHSSKDNIQKYKTIKM